MKKANMILSHLSSQPQFKSLKRQECYQKYINLLSHKWQKAVAFVYIKDETLFIAVTHPGFKMELNYNRDLLKSLLMQLNTYDASCQKMTADKVVVFHSKYHAMPEEKAFCSTVPHYHERSSGTFDIPADEKLKEAFERIKTLISCKQ
ncbi:MAG: hypothetical protein DRG09_01760 [Epsilonproteobacteria bacterium]|nr:MAG: hypothetical protein DRG09_01760 [Campylobacterota bacterium]